MKQFEGRFQVRCRLISGTPEQLERVQCPYIEPDGAWPPASPQSQDPQVQGPDSGRGSRVPAPV
jgi:hypothetical protein